MIYGGKSYTYYYIHTSRLKLVLCFFPMITAEKSNYPWYYDYVSFSDIFKGDPHNY